MGASTGNMLVDDPKTLEGIFAHAPGLIATHCEDTPTIKANEELWKAQVRRRRASRRASAHPLRGGLLQVDAARGGAGQEARLRLHVLHLTTARELELLHARPARGQAHHRRGLRAPPVLRRERLRHARQPHQVQSGDQEREPTARRWCARSGTAASTFSPPTTRRIRWRKRRSPTARRPPACRWCSTRC